MATLQACADCGERLDVVEHWSWYWSRPLCASCFDMEVHTPPADTEVRLLEQMFKLLPEAAQ